ncbi:MAG TPA: TonB-dependent receptor, partial [Gemmatimonadaceae bacterium]|nr:TonB-dependent receptor [Gemmatimonadaceae bacterium]
SIARGYIVGQVVDKASGRPMPAVNILVVGTALRTQTDLDGRYRLPAPPGVYAVRAQRLGSAASQQDGVRVEARVSVTVSFALASAVVQLQGVAVTAAATRATSEDALLAMQKSASRVSDGISAEAIKRAPGASASEAIVRVTGVSIVDNKFAVVRGLSERYSNTLLNGVELPSPEPLKKIVPLDLFPSSLLESIVVSKTATPDKPGDFAGGSVEVTTKEFPNDRVLEANISTGGGTQSTFRTNIPFLPSRGLDWIGFDQGGRRAMPGIAVTPGLASAATERFGEALRNEWTPTPRAITPDFGAGFNLGGRFGGESAPFGYAVSGTYARQTDATPNRLVQLLFDSETGVPAAGYTSNEATTSVNLGLIANLAARVGGSSKFGWKNLYTRNADERLSRAAQYQTDNGNVERQIYQARYVTRELMQTQLTGDHLIPLLWDSRVEWKATVSQSARDEPENRSLIYFKGPAQTQFELSPSNPSPLWFRFLDDRVRSAQLDWSIPIRRVLRDGSLLKWGGLYRQRDRKFDASFFRAWASTDPAVAPVLALPPEQVFTGEVIGARGSALEIRREGEGTVPYESDDDITAAYGMLDLPITSRIRFVGGLRHEAWRLNLFQGTRTDSIGPPVRRQTSDNLLSGNVTISLTSRQNLRLAAYQTVARPDPREVAPDYYVAITGDCANRGNPALVPSRIMNADIRWERYPKPGELMSISAFHKRFTDPIAELLTYQGGTLCTNEYFNLTSARILGSEIEFRRPLTFLPGPLSRMALALNVTMVNSTSSYPVGSGDSTFTRTLKLQGQSDVLGNANLLYTDASAGVEANVLLNYFSDRITRYGFISVSSGAVSEVPNVVEQGRVSLDAKLRKRLGKATVSLSGRNLTDAEVVFLQQSKVGEIRTGYLRPGASFSLGFGYAFR